MKSNQKHICFDCKHHICKEEFRPARRSSIDKTMCGYERRVGNNE